MTVVVDEKLTEKEVNELLEKIEPAQRIFDAEKFFNIIAINEDPLKLQQEMRDE